MNKTRNELIDELLNLSIGMQHQRIIEFSMSDDENKQALFREVVIYGDQ